MKTSISIILTVLLTAALCLAGVFVYGRLSSGEDVGVPALPDDLSAVVTHVSGPVFIVREGNNQPVQVGDRLEPGDVVLVTEGAVAQVQMADRGSALLGSDTLVRFIRFVSAEKVMDMRTEILTGSLSYRIRKLDDTESLIILVDGTEYEVTGTEFVISHNSGQTLLVVGEGEVAVSGVEGERSLVQEGQQIVVRDKGETAGPETVEERNLTLLESFQPLPIVPYGYKDSALPVLLGITTEPGDAIIYIDGIRTGRGSFNGLLPEGTLVDLRIRRRGFTDFADSVQVDKNTSLSITLEPLGLEESLSEIQSQVSLIDRIRSGYEKQIEELRSLMSSQSEAGEAVEDELRAERQRREDLEDENNRLRGLITEIQKLTDQ